MDEKREGEEGSVICERGEGKGGFLGRGWAREQLGGPVAEEGVVEGEKAGKGGGGVVENR